MNGYIAYTNEQMETPPPPPPLYYIMFDNYPITFKNAFGFQNGRRLTHSIIHVVTWSRPCSVHWLIRNPHHCFHGAMGLLALLDGLCRLWNWSTSIHSFKLYRGSRRRCDWVNYSCVDNWQINRLSLSPYISLPNALSWSTEHICGISHVLDD